MSKVYPPAWIREVLLKRRYRTVVIRTCDASPTQYEVYMAGGKVLYYRSRWDSWDVGIGDTLDEAVTRSMATVKDGVTAWEGDDDFFGSVPETVALRIIWRCVREYKRAKATLPR